MMLRSDLVIAVQFALGLVFLISASAKLRHPVLFARGVAAYGLVPNWVAYAVALTVPPFEAALAFAHLTGFGLASMAIGGVVMLAGFAVTVSVVLWSGRPVLCQCLWQGGEIISGATIGRLLVLAAAEAILAVSPGFQGSLAGYPYAELIPAIALLVSGSWVMSLNEIFQVLAPCETCGTARLGESH
jgi:methylamine utilization protein MauE